MKSFSNYCSLDDSFFYAKLDELDVEVEFYINYLFHQEKNKGEALIIARPRKEQNVGVEDLKSFMVEEVKNKKLVACWHYTQYKDWMKKDLKVEFVTKKIREKKDYSLFKKTLFENAHYGAHGTNQRLKYLFKRSNKKISKKLLEDAIKNRQDRFSYSLDILIRGFF